jgi:hypothetical protein
MASLRASKLNIIDRYSYLDEERVLMQVKTRRKMPELNDEERPSILLNKKGPDQALFCFVV